MGPWIWRKTTSSALDPLSPYCSLSPSVMASSLEIWSLGNFYQPKPKQKGDWRSGRLQTESPCRNTEPTLGNWRQLILCSLPVLSSVNGQYHPLIFFLNPMIITLFFVKYPKFVWDVRLCQIKWPLKLIWNSPVGMWTSFWLIVDAQEMVVALNWKSSVYCYQNSVPHSTLIPSMIIHKFGISCPLEWLSRLTSIACLCSHWNLNNNSKA